LTLIQYSSELVVVVVVVVFFFFFFFFFFFNFSLPSAPPSVLLSLFL